MSSQSVSTIRENLASLRQTKWGLVIYRCTYSSDDDWHAFLQRMRDSAKENFADEGEEGAALLSQLQWTIIEDQTRFELASKQAVREAFQVWADRITKDAEAPESLVEPEDSPSPRYTYCVQVDDAALRSIIGEEAVGEGYVNLIKRKWPNRSYLLQVVREQLEQEDTQQEDDDEDREDEDDEFSDVEGCKDSDVGFIKIDPDFIYPGAYSYLDSGSDWHLLYVRPPAIGPS